jgi:hypothetical protein
LDCSTEDFAGSADLVAELRLPNAQIADDQTVHVKWARRLLQAPRTNRTADGQKEIDPVSPVARATVQQPNDKEAITPRQQSRHTPHQATVIGKRAKAPGYSALAPPVGLPHTQNAAERPANPCGRPEISESRNVARLPLMCF